MGSINAMQGRAILERFLQVEGLESLGTVKLVQSELECPECRKGVEYLFVPSFFICHSIT